SNTSYHWQARAVDLSNSAGSYANFGGNAESVADFTVDTTGPTTSASAVAPTPTNAAPTVTATETDVTSNVAAAEYFIDSAGAVGAGTAMAAADGAFSSGTENVTGTAYRDAVQRPRAGDAHDLRPWQGHGR